MSNNRLWWASLDKGSPRYNDWFEILGTNDVPLRSPASSTCTLIGEGDEEVYLLDLAQLSEDQLSRLVLATAKKFRADPGFVRQEIMREGYPIRARDCYCVFSLRAFI